MHLSQTGPAGRLARTHSQKRPLSFREICEEAFGVLNIHPWDFWNYTFEDYLLKRNGFYNNRDIQLRAEFQNFRLVAYFCVYPHLTKGAKNKPYTDIIPDIYEKSTKTEDFKQWFEEMRKKAKKRVQKLKNIGKRA
jgi:hypothetical protein